MFQYKERCCWQTYWCISKGAIVVPLRINLKFPILTVWQTDNSWGDNRDAHAEEMLVLITRSISIAQSVSLGASKLLPLLMDRGYCGHVPHLPHSRAGTIPMNIWLVFSFSPISSETRRSFSIAPWALNLLWDASYTISDVAFGKIHL